MEDGVDEAEREALLAQEDEFLAKWEEEKKTSLVRGRTVALRLTLPPPRPRL